MKGSSVAPASVTSMTINGVALLFSLLTAWWLLHAGESVDALRAVLILGASYALPIILLEAIWLKPGQTGTRSHTRRVINVPRVLVKLLGLAVTLLLIVGIYSLFPEYRGAFYSEYYAALRTLAPWCLPLAVPYFFWMDGRSGSERDGYWHMGQLALLRWRQFDRKVVSQHLLGWAVKLFFLPLMFVYFAGKVHYFRSFNFELVFSSFRMFYEFAIESLFYIDLLIAFVGYLCTFKLTDSHIRSTEPTFLGWAVAIMCYQPFWAFFSAQYIQYQSGTKWGDWLSDYNLLYTVWGSCILILLSIYVWSSVAFGIRFSNLTHRGILTNGPYRYCKHPAYVSKNLSWWLISMPFMVDSTVDETVRYCILLLLLNTIYLLRARTEERHLSQDPDYRAYARYIEEKGLFRKVGQWLPAFKFSPGELFNLRSSKT